MPLQPFRHPGVVDGAANVQSSIMNMQNIRQNDLLNLGKQAELDEFNATAGLRQNSYAAEDLQAGLKRVYTLGLLNNVNGIKQFASQWAQQGGPNAVVAQEIIENVDQDFQGMMGHLTPLFSDSESAEYTAPIEGRDENGNPVFYQPSKKGGGQVLPGITPPPDEAKADPEKVRIADAAGLTGQRRTEFLLGTGEFGNADGGIKMPRPLTPEIAASLGIPEKDRNKYQIGSTGEVELIPVPAGEATDTKPFSKMPSEGRIKLGLIANAAKLKANAEQYLFDENGNYNGASATVPGSKAKIAINDIKEALMNMLRTESGAAITDEELSRQVDAMLPNATDFNETARGKWNRIDSKIQSMHSALAGGFTDIPPELQLGTPTQNTKVVNGKTYTLVNGEWYEG